ncbi:hypothetical protein [uncultured Lutibacter sp.]|uniref:hypothetical protein n=1 Tax=uncultured Lutibacter sp. TaxID=437739 RepID=UPI0026078574|nr:hypothetical protein [uncultured Lutibacter sp.]
MNSNDFYKLMQNTATIDALKTSQLDAVINEYPYFQLAKALQLKGLNKTNSFKYNQALKKTAAYTIDRSVLFDFITTKSFSKTTTNEPIILEEIELIEPETIKSFHKKITASFNEKNKEVIENSKPEIISADEKPSEILEIGKPLNFKNSEPHSFNEWMQLISQKPIIRKEIVKKEPSKPNKKSLIEKFIKSNPKIKPVDKNALNKDISHESSSENESLMTETLAKVYLEQNKFEKAIKAYRILSLKYPEKSGFFADQIKAIKKLQKK